MAGFGNAGVPPKVLARMDEAAAIDTYGANCVSEAVWSEYAASRPYVAPTPAKEAASIVLRNRAAIIVDATKRKALAAGGEAAAETALRAIAFLLSEGVPAAASPEQRSDERGDEAAGEAAWADALQRVAAARLIDDSAALAAFLDRRICVPRDMGAPPASRLKWLAARLRSEGSPG